MKRNIKILLCTIVVILLSAGCTLIYDDNESHCTDEQSVTIVVTIDNANVRSSVEMRSAGTVNPDGNSGWDPEKEPSLDYERTINHIFLFVYKKGETTPYKVFFYYAEANSPLSQIPGLEIRSLNVPSGSPSSFTMNLELFSGRYNFVLLVNSEAALEKMRNNHKIDNIETLVEENQILTSDDLKGHNRKYLPMVGQSELYVPDHRVGSDSDRLELIPEIKLERIHARVEFILTTADESGKEYLSPILPLSTVTGLSLLNEQKKYTVMPSANDYTVTGGGQLNPIRANALDSGTPMTERESFASGAIDEQGKIRKFKDRLLPYDSHNPQEKKYIYVAPSTLASSESDCLALLFKVKFGNDSEDTEYRIPLTNVGAGITGKQKYITRRNTIYRINAKLIGRDLTVLDYNVINWTNQDVDIPW